MNHSHLVIKAVVKFEQDGKQQERWTKVGALLPNSKGGYTVKLDLIPTNLATTDLVALPPKEREDREEG